MADVSEPDLAVDLALLVMAAPPAAGVETSWRLASAAVAGGRRAGIFLMDDGVHAARLLGERAAALQPGAVALVRCAQDAAERGAAGHPAVYEGSQADWARMVARARRVLVFS